MLVNRPTPARPGTAAMRPLRRENAAEILDLGAKLGPVFEAAEAGSILREAYLSAR